MNAKAYIHKVLVSRKGQKISFQIKLPNDLVKITSIHLSHFLKTPDGQQQTILRTTEVYKKENLLGTKTLRTTPRMGELKLQVADSANVFYAEELFLEDNTLVLNDFAYSAIWTGKTWTHGAKNQSYPLQICGTNTIIKGYYTDNILKELQLDLQYDVIISLWYEHQKTP